MVSIVTLDVIMIVTGLLSALSTTGSGGLAHWVWYFWSCAAFGGVLYLLWGPLKALSAAQSGAMDGVYRSNLIFLTLVWLCYPVVFLIGPQGLKMTSTVTSVWVILVLDVTAKVIYGFVAASRFDSLPAPAPATRR